MSHLLYSTGYILTTTPKIFNIRRYNIFRYVNLSRRKVQRGVPTSHFYAENNKMIRSEKKKKTSFAFIKVVLVDLTLLVSRRPSIQSSATFGNFHFLFSNFQFIWCTNVIIIKKNFVFVKRGSLNTKQYYFLYSLTNWTKLLTILY